MAQPPRPIGSPPPAAIEPAADREAPTPARSLAAEEPKPRVTFPGRALEWKGDAWWAQELGWTRSGRQEDLGARLTLLGFRPGGADDEGFQREAWVAEPGLEAISDLRLLEILEASSPFAAPGKEPKPFFGPRSSSRPRSGPRPSRGEGRSSGRRGGGDRRSRGGSSGR